MDVIVSGKLVSLNQGNVFGAGGEATVFAKGKTAYKIYHRPSVRKAKKLEALLVKARAFPAEVLAPIELAYDTKGKVVGYTMRLAPKEAEAVKFLANRNYRTANNIDTIQVVEIFILLGEVLAKLHRIGVVVGDLNDLNELFANERIYYIDSDSFQFEGYACEVGTEDYLCPSLYDQALQKKVSFSPETDWYSFAVLLYRSLLMVHPYGGVYPGIQTLTERAQRRLTVLDPKVKYPKLGLNPEVLSDELLEQFWVIFGQGSYNQFPISLLADYRDILIPCPKCGRYFPSSRGSCPHCSAAVAIPVTTSFGGYGEQELFTTGGPIVFSKVQESAIYAVAHENGQAVLYSWRSGRTERFELFTAHKDLRYDIAAGLLIVGRVGSRKLVVFNPATRTGEVTETDLFDNWPMMAGTGSGMYRLANGSMLHSTFVELGFLDQMVATVIPGQSWISAHDANGQGTAIAIGRVFDQWIYQVITEAGCFDAEVTALQMGEKLVRVKVRASDGRYLVLRETKESGKSYLRLDLLDKKGQLLKNVKRHWKESKHGQIWQSAFAQNALVYFSDDRLIAEDLLTGKVTYFVDAENLLTGAEMLYAIRGKLLAVSERKVVLLRKES